MADLTGFASVLVGASSMLVGTASLIFVVKVNRKVETGNGKTIGRMTADAESHHHIIPLGEPTDG